MLWNVESSENEYHDESWQIKGYRSVWFQKGSKFKNTILKCTLKARIWLKWLIHVRIQFLGLLSDIICKQNVQIIASNASNKEFIDLRKIICLRKCVSLTFEN